jgi:hypothetical protein
VTKPSDAGIDVAISHADQKIAEMAVDANRPLRHLAPKTVGVARAKPAEFLAESRKNELAASRNSNAPVFTYSVLTRLKLGEFFG